MSLASCSDGAGACSGSACSGAGATDDGGPTSLPPVSGTDGGNSVDASKADATRDAGDSATPDATQADSAPRADSGPAAPPDGGSPRDAGPAADAGSSSPDAGTSCAPPQFLCNGTCVASDVKNCGACGHDCTTLAHTSGAVTCQAGACALPPSSCAPGWAHCSTKPDDGCETNISKPEHCGGCGNACVSTTPVCATTIADGGDAVHQCVAACSSSQTLCGLTCSDLKSDPQNCGACGNVCVPPINGTPLCGASACSFACNTGFHQCTTTCADNTSPATCGADCSPCPLPAHATTTTCDGTTCGFTCEPAYLSFGGACIPAFLYVDSTNGVDTNPGTKDSPFKTFKQTMTAVRSKQVVLFAGGSYRVADGDDFSAAVPDGVWLQGDVNGTTFEAQGGDFVFQGDVTMAQITLVGFGRPLVATRGTQSIKEVTISQQTGSISLSGTANATLGQLVLGPTPTTRELISVTDTAHLLLVDSTLDGQATDCTTANVNVGVHATGSASVTVSDDKFTGYLSPSVLAEGSSNPTIVRTVFAEACDQSIIIKGTATAAVTDVTAQGIVNIQTGASGTFSGGTFNQKIEFDYVKMAKVRTITLKGKGWIYIADTSNGSNYDFGLATDPGNNTFQSDVSPQLMIFASGLTVNASGNQWIANEQTADANGKMAVGSTSDTSSGRNFEIVGQSTLVF